MSGVGSSVFGGRLVDIVEEIGAQNQKQCEFNMSTTPRTSILFKECSVG